MNSHFRVPTFLGFSQPYMRYVGVSEVQKDPILESTIPPVDNNPAVGSLGLGTIPVTPIGPDTVPAPPVTTTDPGSLPTTNTLPSASGNCDALYQIIVTTQNQLAAGKYTPEAYAQLQNTLSVAMSKFQISGCKYPATTGGGTGGAIIPVTPIGPDISPAPPIQSTDPTNPGQTLIPVIPIAAGNSTPVPTTDLSGAPIAGGGGGGGDATTPPAAKKFNWWIVLAGGLLVISAYQTSKQAA